MARKRKELPALSNIEISAVAAEGKSIAKVAIGESPEDKITIFIPFGAPGDIVDIKIDKKKKRYAEAHITRMISPSALRVEPKCSYFGTCGGCKWQHIPYSEQLRNKRQQVVDSLERIAKVNLPEIPEALGSEDIYGYRNKMEYTFSSKKWRTWEEINSGREFEDSDNALGFHIPGAFDKVLHIEECHLQQNIGNEIRNFILQHAEENGLEFYNIRENHGLLRTLMIRIASTGEIMACVVFGEDDKEKIRGIMDAVKDRFPEITSLLYVVNLKLNDSIADQDVILFSGRDYIEEAMGDLRFRISAKSFYQTNSRQAYELYSKVREFAYKGIPADERPLVYDLYTGTGTIANFVADRASEAVGIEYVPEAIEDAKINSEVNGIVNTRFFAGDMKDILNEDFIRENGKPRIIITDPPRSGMHQDVVNVILAVEPEIIVYVSCNPATQARDLALLDCKYEVTDIQPVDMFPHTHHIENVVRMRLRENVSAPVTKNASC